MVDTRKYGAGPVRPDDVRGGSLTKRIVDVHESSKFNCLVLEFDDGSRLNLNQTTTKAMQKAYGFESEDWKDETVELSMGSYKDWNVDPPEDKETVALRAVSGQPPASGNSGTKALMAKAPPSASDDLNDDVPFS